MIVLCTIAVMLSGGYRDYPQLRGVLLHDGDTYWTVDFSEEFKKRHYNTNLEVTTFEGSPARIHTKIQTPVQLVHGNDCLYVNPPKEWLK
jgi:hypothetical protein